MKALGSYPEIRQIWVNHLYGWNDDSAWENGEDYQRKHNQLNIFI